MKALIIGGGGFVGKYLIGYLRDIRGWFVAVTKMPSETVGADGCDIYDLDILERGAIDDVLAKTRPDAIFHLAAQSSAALSWKNPALTIDVNIKGVVNLLDAVRGLDYKLRLLLVGSGEEYGHVLESEIPVGEDNRIRPGNIYAATKACQNMIGKIYADAYDIDLVMVRAFNHTGAGQASSFVVSDFCKQVAEIEAGKQEPVIRVGNLSVKRDFTDVRDVVRAYALLMETGKKGEIYNVGSGKAVPIRYILDKILAQSTAKISVEPDESRYRPVDVPVIEADISKIHECTGWKPEIDLDATIADMLRFWRGNILECGEKTNENS